MQWLERLNESLDYIEGNLEKGPVTAEAAKIACCSAYHYQRMFSYLAGVPLSEYVRRRRMTKAAFDLQNGEKVLDTAVKYGYESPTAFNRAFRSVRGISPSAAQKEGAGLKAYQRISFTISIKGETEMEYRIETKEAFRIVGVSAPLEKEIEKNFDTVPAMWGKAATDGTVPRLAQMMDSEPKGILGVSACMGEDQWALLYFRCQHPAGSGGDDGVYGACMYLGHFSRLRGHAQRNTGAGKESGQRMAARFRL